MLLATPCLIHLPERDYELFCLAANILSPPGDPKACSLLGPGLHSESGWDSHPNPALLMPFLILIYPLESFCKRRSPPGSEGIGSQGYNEFFPLQSLQRLCDLGMLPHPYLPQFPPKEKNGNSTFPVGLNMRSECFKT